ncbi:MAG: phosphoribosylaminoimidazole carboxylase, ATPase subunit [Lachnospiraceae bacterium]|jgi:5-(carboxyamino)imidazole ribonucleotide synthase|nr:phosphoribosylaminoimidazole carboxylase, ATPase subunit [Lachnospiraceae bacterium]
MERKKIRKLNPPSTIGIIGGGQLGRMLTVEAKRMGYHVVVLDPKENAPAGQVADQQITADFSDLGALKELAQMTDVITFEFEHINVELLNQLEGEGYWVFPSSNTLRKIQNKYIQKCMLRENGIPTPEFYSINSLEELKDKFNKLGNKAILKTCKEGYDGKGNMIIHKIEEIEQAFYKFEKAEIMVEKLIDFTKEVSIIVARNQEKIEFYPVSENVHKNSILIKSMIPANISLETEKVIQNLSKRIVDLFDDYGVFCIEFFIDSNSNVLVNEIAPRPHNSGHYSIEGCICSQFEQLIRIITGMPLGSSELRMPCVMYNILGSQDTDGTYYVSGVDSLLALPDCHLHLYGKPETNYLKKIGHITAIDTSVEKADNKAKNGLSKLKIVTRN